MLVNDRLIFGPVNAQSGVREQRTRIVNLTLKWRQYLGKHNNLQPSFNVMIMIDRLLCQIQYYWKHTDGLAQDCSNPSTLAMELLQSWIKPSIYGVTTNNKLRSR